MSHHTPDKRVSFTNRLLAVLSLCLLVLPGFLAGQKRKVTGKPPRASPTAEPQPTPPTVEFQAIPSRDNVEHGQTVTVALLIASKSNVTLRKPKLIVSGDAFETERRPSLPNSIAPFQSVRDAVVLKARNNADFTKHSIVLTLEYSWDSGAREFKSEQSATVTLEVKRPFQDEAGGLPSGTAALLLLILPAIPATLGYVLLDGLRKHEGLKLPTFGVGYVVTTFLVSVVVNAVAFLITGRHWWLDYSNPREFIVVVVSSFAIGASVPGVRWALGGWQARQDRQWEFQKDESLEGYLRKAFKSPHKPDEFRWVEAFVVNEKWEGILLQQPDGATVLGAQLQVGYDRRVSAEEWNRFGNEVIRSDGTVIDLDRLLKMIETGELTLGFYSRIRRGGKTVDPVVVIDEVKNLKRRTSPKASPPVIPIP
jgi:hypothetical protein